ncbi:MAG: type II toxin-antitoxin system RelE/ParE family toxin [Oscillospiraceae bacterium]|nr:type II toxin-antitoxin system RelE/ParE family toxin [Oscillospiraceae bacterium]
MDYKLKYLPSAKQDLKDIKKYLSVFYPGTPARFAADLRSHIHGLRTHPQMYPVYDDFPLYRYIPIGDYIVFYAVDSAGGYIEIHRILHGKRDIRQIF